STRAGRCLTSCLPDSELPPDTASCRFVVTRSPPGSGFFHSLITAEIPAPDRPPPHSPLHPHAPGSLPRPPMTAPRSFAVDESQRLPALCARVDIRNVGVA